MVYLTGLYLVSLYMIVQNSVKRAYYGNFLGAATIQGCPLLAQVQY